MPIVFYFWSVSKAETKSGENINDFAFYNAERVSCAQWCRVGCAGEVWFVCFNKFFFQFSLILIYFCNIL